MQQKRQFLPPFPEDFQRAQGEHGRPFDSKRTNPLPPLPLRPQVQPHFHLPSTMKTASPREMKISNVQAVQQKQLAPQRRQSARRPSPGRRGGARSRPAWVWRVTVTFSLLMLIMAAILSVGNGETGAWFADTFRAILGPTVTTQIESWYLGATDLLHQAQYQLDGKQVSAPWSVTSATGMPSLTPPPHVPHTLGPVPMSLQSIMPLFSPTISGAGSWETISMAPAPYGNLPLAAKTFIQPDSSHPFAVVTLLKFDSRFILLHMVAGTSQPGGPLGIPGPGVIPAAKQAGNALLAAFNGGFMYADGQYGMAANGTVYVPPQPGAATIAVTKQGQLIMGAWGVDPRLNSSNTDLAAWRQNDALLINHGTINSLTQDGAAWGATILNSAYTWRSGIGITAQGSLVYAGGNSLTARTLAIALKAAGAVMAMQTDINPYWVRAFVYNRASNGALSITKLNPNMQGTGTEYLYGTARDFFYLTRFAPPLSTLLASQP